MKALSLWQPWASYIFQGKDVENRPWPIRYRGLLLIHAAKKYDYDDAKWIWDNRESLLGYDAPDIMPAKSAFPCGYLLGTVKVIDCVTESESPWFFGPYGHVYSTPNKFPKPIPFRGQQGLFNVPDELLP